MATSIPKISARPLYLPLHRHPSWCQRIKTGLLWSPNRQGDKMKIGISVRTLALVVTGLWSAQSFA
ncbi:MAG: hypothetical protein K2X47_01505, partial [Bdellovibrionales bacterium]|nr:hypothetical protein [Bdellovibrionales bacterium]